MLEGKKTYLAALAAVLIAGGTCLNQYVNGEPVNIELIVSSVIALAMIFLRKGIKTEIIKK